MNYLRLWLSPRALYFALLGSILLSTQVVAKPALPEALLQGMIRFELHSEDYFKALTSMDQAFIQSQPVAYARALKGFNIHGRAQQVLDGLDRGSLELSSEAWFDLGKMEYFAGRCKPALRIFKQLKNALPLALKQEWAYYRANCFIQLGSPKTAGEALRQDFLSGIWAAHAYYNLAIALGETSGTKDKARIALFAAAGLNGTVTDEEKELNNRINFAYGAYSLEDNLADQAITYFNKVYLDSHIAPQALYLTGIAHMERRDYRAATQYWDKVAGHHVMQPGVAEAMLAVPFALERAGYISQALESYLEASTIFESELKSIRDFQKGIEKFGVVEVLIEGKQIKGLEWFLAKDIARRSIRAAYYTYLMQNADIFDHVRLLSELGLVQETLDYWSEQLPAFDTALKHKAEHFARKSQSFSANVIAKKATHIENKLRALQAGNAADAAAIRNALAELNDSRPLLQARAESIEQQLAGGAGRLGQKRQQTQQFLAEVRAKQQALAKIVSALDEHLTALVSGELDLLYDQMVLNYEKAEQGLVSIFEVVAEDGQVRSTKGAQSPNGKFQ